MANKDKNAGASKAPVTPEQKAAAEKAAAEKAAAEKAAADKAAAENKAPKDKKAPKRPTYTHKGKKYAFKKDSPAKLSLDGEAIAITNLIKDEDAMEYLIEGENYFVERINTPQ